MIKDRTLTFRVSSEDVQKLEEINFVLFDSTISDTLRGLIGREYQALSKAGIIK